MADHLFGSTLYRTRKAMLAAIVESWITGNGSAAPSDVRDFLSQKGDEAIAAEIISDWELDRADTYDDEIPSHMAAQGYDAADLAAVVADYRKGVNR